jgi:tetratricopeptide (TPR) repeat protein
MQENLQVPLNNQKYQWLDMVETLSVIGSVGGAIAAVVVKEVALASMPLSVSMLLNVVNRRRLLDSIEQSNLVAITQVIEENVETQNKLKTLTKQLADIDQINNKNYGEAQAHLALHNEQLQQLTTTFSQGQELNNQESAQLRQENSATQAKLGLLSGQLEQLQQLTDKLLQEQNNKLINEQAKIAKTVDALREIETCTQSIRINPISANAFFNRGLSYQRLGDREAALGDYTEAIRTNPHYAEAYQTRGLIYADLGDKKAAVKDLREAARLFFENGEIDKYQIARDLSKKFHDMDTSDGSEVTETTKDFKEIALESLFSF